MNRNDNSSRADALYDSFINIPMQKVLQLLFENHFLKREINCLCCSGFNKLVPYKKSPDAFAWRCYSVACPKYKEYISVRKDSFFEHLGGSLVQIMKIIIKYATRTPRFSIIDAITMKKKFVLKVIDKLILLMPVTDFCNNKLGGPGINVQVDETMLNYKCKSHRGRSPLNRTDSICIVEFVNNITRAYASVIPNKSQATLVPIIMQQVANGSIIHTDEHGGYYNIGLFGYNHGVVCHKYNFVNRVTGVHTQGIESFNGELKYEIKKRKGINTNKRAQFLHEFCFYFNNREDFFFKVLELIKV